jgi:Carboxypeptidase regulatory-like domain
MSNFRSWLVLVLLLGAVNVSAQTTSGSMSGTVVDSSGQVVPGADVIVTNEQTGEVRRTVTSEVGAFSFPALLAGPYTVRAELSGFRPIEVKNNQVLANNRLAVPPLQLEVGSLAEAVTVTAVGEAVATTTTAHQAILDLSQVENLSIRGRDPISLLKILPGVSLMPNDQEVFGGGFATNVPDIGGGRGQTIQVDGVNGGDSNGGGNFSGATNMDAIAEVNVQLSSYTAEYGLNGGAQVNYITKHGGSEYHGSLYSHNRHEKFNALNYFNKKDGLPKPLYRFTNLGGTLGGPIPRLPKVNPNGDKLFFFYSIDDTKVKVPQITRRYQLPTALERQGDFSQSFTPSGALIRVIDPLTGQQFPNNRIPADRAHAAGVAFLNLFPMPNAQGSGYNFVFQEESLDRPRRQHLLRVDYRPTANDSFAWKGQTWFTKMAGYNADGAAARWGLVRQRYDFTADQLKLDYTRIFGSRTVFEFSAGFFRSTEDGPAANDRELAGIQRASHPAIGALPQFTSRHNPLGLIPKARFGQVQSSSGGTDCGGAVVQPCNDIFYDNRWPITGEDSAFPAAINLTHTRGTHTFKMGIMRENEFNGQARSGIFAGEFNFAHNNIDAGSTQYPYANAYIGHVLDYTEELGRVPDYRIQNTLAWFIQDTWKMKPTLTFDIGLRMYKWSPPYSGSGEASAFSFERFDPSWGGRAPVLYDPILVSGAARARNPLTGEILPSSFIGQMVPGTGYSCGVITPEAPCNINGMVIQEDPNYRNGDYGFVEPMPVQFDPRFGMAWAPNPKTVLRVATGLFHDAIGGSVFSGGAAFRFTRVTRFTDLNSYLGGTSAVAPNNVSGIVREGYKLPSTHKYSIGLQREIGWRIVTDIAYVGEFTRYLGDDFNYNAIPAGARFNPVNRDPSKPDSATVGLQPDRRDPGALPDVFLRPIRGFGDININEPVNTSRYDSLQAQVSRRFTGGIELAGSYTLARAYENDRFQGNPFTGRFREYDNDIQRHIVVTSYQIEIPNGGRLLGNSPVARGILDNWRISGISTFATGRWEDVSMSYNPGFEFGGGGELCDGSGSAPYHMVGDPMANAPKTEAQWFDTSVFRPAVGRGDRGNEGACNNHKIQGPGFHNHDVTFFKDFRLPRNQRITFKAEAYNLFNQVSWQTFDNTGQFNAANEQTDANFGRITAARNERRMVFSLRYTF